jgi:hypothetical protein
LTASQAAARVRPGALPPDLWALRPGRLAFRGAQYDADAQPALVSASPLAVLWLALEAEDLVILGPYGEVSAFAGLVSAARQVALESGRARLVASVRNDEIERFEWLQRLGFVLIEARLGSGSAGEDDASDEARMWGDIAARDELVFALAVRLH